MMSVAHAGVRKHVRDVRDNIAMFFTRFMLLFLLFFIYKIYDSIELVSSIAIAFRSEILFLKNLDSHRRLH